MKYREASLIHGLKVSSLSKGRNTENSFFKGRASRKSKLKILPDSRISLLNPMSTGRNITTPFTTSCDPLNITIEDFSK